MIAGVPATPDDATGRFWIHGDSDVGEAHNIGTGLHTIPADDSGASADDHTRLCNHYEDVNPIEQFESSWFVKGLTGPIWSITVPACPRCPAFTPPTISHECLTCGVLGRTLDSGDQYLSRILLAVGDAANGQVATLLNDGTLQLVTDRVGPALRSSLASGAVWVSAAESSPNIGQGTTEPAALALSTDGTQILDRVLQSPSGVFSLRDLERGEVVGAMSATAQPFGPAPRSDFQAVYSRALGRLFLVGGNDLTTRQATHDIWWFDLDAYQWNRVALDGYAPERVLAATYSYRDRHLWVLDDYKVGAFRRARLVRIDPATGQSEQIGAWPRAIWPRDGVFDKHWLMLDSDGNVLFVASSEWVKEHAVVRIALDGSPHVDGIRLAPRALLLPPAVDSEGYTFVLEKKNHMPIVQRVKDLNAKPGRWLDLGGCL